MRVRRAQRTVEDASQPNAPSLFGLLVLSLLVTFGIGSFEVGLTLQGQQLLNLRASEIGWVLAVCSLAMILVQVFVIAPLIKRVGSRLLAPAFLAMAAGIALLPFATSYVLLLIGVGLIATASGLLIPALAYLTSLAAGIRQGAALGKQTAAASLGQAAGSATAGCSRCSLRRRSGQPPACLGWVPLRRIAFQTDWKRRVMNANDVDILTAIETVATTLARRTP